jgi:cytoskeletal protein RodZ
MSSFGDEIRRERQLREISLREVAKATKINVRYLEALEGNHFEHLPGGVFNRGFVRAYAEFIGVDPEGMVNAYLLEEKAQAEHGKTRQRGVLRRQQRPVAAEPAGPQAGDDRSPSVRRWWVLAGVVAVGLLIWAVLALTGVARAAQPQAAEARQGERHG